jgi:hypothetical protein
MLARRVLRIFRAATSKPVSVGVEKMRLKRGLDAIQQWYEGAVQRAYTKADSAAAEIIDRWGKRIDSESLRLRVLAVYQSVDQFKADMTGLRDARIADAMRQFSSPVITPGPEPGTICYEPSPRDKARWPCI